MSDIMRPMPFSRLMTWALEEYRTVGSVFGVSRLTRYAGAPAGAIFGEGLEAPFGPAAGPHTQLAQNIVAAYAAGARFFELKTVQVTDGAELSKCVPKPCISAEDEGYNCEWSTELTVPQAMEEYIKAWFACKLLAKELDLGDPEGFVFNMSVGYDLAGIRSPKVDAFIEGLKDASGTPVWKACTDWALANLDQFRRVDGDYVRAISPKVSRSVTESTLHGCPPEEIEAIAAYLMGEKGLHTYVKCNPTLLGYEFARRTLDDLGYGYLAFDDHHFRNDLQWADAVPMLRRLLALGEKRGLAFGVKLTNTFPVEVKAGELPSGEMYLSGRALYPLSLSLAAKLAAEFNGALPISFSGGADALNIRPLARAGIRPVTVATTLLKPGGYQRLAQMAEALAGLPAPPAAVDGAAVAALAEEARTGPRCRKPAKPAPSRKMAAQVPLTDCFAAPCRDGCPIHQDIPAYLMRVNAGNYEEALEVILRRNPLPFITGTICTHRCQDKCMRNYYDESVYIRDYKLKAAEGGYEAVLPRLKPAAPVSGKRVAVVGGGPAGMAAAYFLGRAGVDVTLFEATDRLGGVVRRLIPSFRISDGAIDKDEAIVRAMGVKVRLNAPVSSARELEDMGFTHIIFATGAQKHGDPRLEYGDYVNFTQVLAAIKAGGAPDLGRDVAVIGGGNSAMDTARAVRRLPGVERVRLVYRRTRQYMPAEEEELELALAEGVEFLELLAPVGVKDGVLTCRVMELGAPDASGRRAPADTGRTLTLPCDTLIAAVGEGIDETVDVGRWPVIGDRRRGPATVVEAIADAMEAARAIADFDPDLYVDKNVNPDYQKPLGRRGTLCADCAASPEPRCLGCATVCETCAEVCPNRANAAVWVPGMRQRQIVHLDGLCNECGNCATFCPYDSAPYKDKFTLYWSGEDFQGSENQGFLPLENGRTRVRLGGVTADYDVSDPGCGLYEPIRRLILAVYENYPYLLS